jgi:hypothetical protein
LDLVFGWMAAFIGGFTNTPGGIVEKSKGGVAAAKEHIGTVWDRMMAEDEPKTGRTKADAASKSTSSAALDKFHDDYAKSQRIAESAAADAEMKAIIRKEASTIIKAASAVPFVTDSLQAIGGVSGGSFEDPALQVQQESLTELRAIKENTKKTSMVRGWPV